VLIFSGMPNHLTVELAPSRGMLRKRVELNFKTRD